MPGRRIAVLGEMLELGDGHVAGHERVGSAAAEIVDRLVVVGEDAADIARGAARAGLEPDAIIQVGDRDAALAALLGIVAPGDSVLVKASRGIALDVLVDELVAALGSHADEAPKP
jgi:UDP-N-acetylmuramoyl-tripeptide--D-alanyl-D-alanine ligase